MDEQSSDESTNVIEEQLKNIQQMVESIGSGEQQNPMYVNEQISNLSGLINKFQVPILNEEDVYRINDVISRINLSIKKKRGSKMSHNGEVKTLQAESAVRVQQGERQNVQGVLGKVESNLSALDLKLSLRPGVTGGISQLEVADHLRKTGWKGYIAPAQPWAQYEKGDYRFKDPEGYSNETYKIFVQPKPEYFVESVRAVGDTLSDMISKGSVSGAVFKFAKTDTDWKVGMEPEWFANKYDEKICIYTNSVEDMVKVVKALNSSFKGKAYEYGAESNLDAYDMLHGAKYTYGVSPLIHVRRGGAGNHVDINNERRSRGEDVSKPPSDWSIAKPVIEDLRENALSSANMKGYAQEEAPVSVREKNRVEYLHNSKVNIPATSTPIDLYLADKHLQIVKAEGWNVSYLLVDPEALNADARRGFKGIREGEVVEVGREVPIIAQRFTLPDTVSRRHLKISLDKGVFAIEDFSTNGTTVVSAK